MKENYRFVIIDKKTGKTIIVNEELFFQLVSEAAEQSCLTKIGEDKDFANEFDIVRVKVK